MTTQAERWNKALKEYEQSIPDEPLQIIDAFLKLLDQTEESESGREFHPVTIGSVRVWETARVEVVLAKMRKIVRRDTLDQLTKETERLGLYK